MNKTHANGFLTFFTTLLFALFASQPVVAATLCDDLGSLEADPSAVSTPVAFQDINSEGHCQNKPPCPAGGWIIVSMPCLILYPFAISKPALRSSNSQLCYM